MVKRAHIPQSSLFDTELADLPAQSRWREWMSRVEAVLFAAAEPVSLEVLRRVVGRDCNLDLLIDDISAELAARPYEIVFVGGGWQFRTRPRHADVLHAAAARKKSAAKLSATEMLVLAAIAYHQPVTRAVLSEITGRDVSRDIIAQLRDQALIAAGPRAPRPGAPYSYVTTRRFLEYFSLQTLGDLPAIEMMEDAGLLDEPGLRKDDPAAIPRMGDDPDLD